MADNGQQLSELESLQLRANMLSDESLESTRRMVNLCEDSQASGARTLEMLDQQQEQLNRIESGMDNMNAEMKQAEKHITGMEKWCGLCVCPWNRTRRVRDKAGLWEANGNSGENSGGAVVKNQPGRGDGAVADGPYIKRINNDAREDEMEENMQAVGGMLSNLKSMAQDMGSTIESQNQQIDRMQIKGTSVDVRIRAANTRTEKLLK